MRSTDSPPVLPEEVRALLGRGHEEWAGERLREHAEELVRRDPGRGRAWAQRTASAQFEGILFPAYVRWAAGAVLHLVGEPVLARDQLSDAADAMERAGRPDLADRVALTLLDVYGEQQRVQKARSLARRLEARFLERGDAERAAVALANLGCAEDAVDRVDRARALWLTAASTMEPGGLRHLLARANLANSSSLMGRFVEAESEHRQVAERARELGLDALALQADLNLAETEFCTGKVSSALGRWQRVIKEADAMGDQAAALVASIDLAVAETEMGDLESAKTRLEVALPATESAGLQRERARVIRQLAVVRTGLGARGEWSRASRLLSGPALRVYRDLLLVDLIQLDPTCDPSQVARAARRLGAEGLRHRGAVGLAWAAKRLQERGGRGALRSERMAREALKSSRSAWVRMVAYQVLGRSRTKNAGRYLHRAVYWADQLHGRLVAMADRTAFLEMRGDVYLDLIAVLIDRGRAKDRRRALDLLAKFRSGWLLDELARRADAGDDGEVRRWTELRRRLATLLAQIEGQDEPRVRRFGASVDSELRSVERQLREVELTLARRRPALVPASASEPVSSRLLKRLPSDHLFVEYFLDGSDVLIFVVHGGDLRVVRAPVANEVRRLAASVRFHMDTNTWRSGAPGDAADEALRDRLRQLGRLLLGRVPVDGWEALWVAPHAEIFHVPWAALEFPDGRVLADRASFSLVPGAGVAASLLCGRPNRPRRIGACGAGGDELPLVAKELQMIADLEPQSSVRESATREDLLEMLASHDVVHLAGHAAFLDGIPSASGLRLSDGYVTVHDLAGAPIRAQLVSFGVCSGARVADHADLRYEGFLRSLLAGGVRTVLGAISPVHDEVAYAFDREFIRSLRETDDPGHSYRRAVGGLRRTDPRPATWGNFHLFGDHRSWRTA